MDIENSKAQMKKGILEFCILAILKNGPFYVSNLIDEMKKAELLVVEGTLYPLLNRLKNDGLLSYEWIESKSGPPRKYYNITPSGEEFLNQLNKSWQNLVASVNTITNNQHG